MKPLEALTPVLARETGLNDRQVAGALRLLEEGATVPFIARYRKEQTGSLDEVQVRDLLRRYESLKELEARRSVVLESIRSQDRLAPDLERKILAAATRAELEDLYLPYRPRKATRADLAREAGLEPLARRIVETADPRAQPLGGAAVFLNPEAGIDTPEKALAGACDILAEEPAHDPEVRRRLRELLLREGELASRARKEAEGQRTKYLDYYDRREKAAAIPSHRLLALLRGEKEKVLRLSLEYPREKALALLRSRLIRHPASGAAALLEETARDCLERLLEPSIETEVRRTLRERSEEEAIRVFAANLEALLLHPPAGRRRVLGVDPGFRTGCKLAVVDGTGRFLESATIYPHEPQKRTGQAEELVRTLIARHGIELVAVGNGTAGRETHLFLRSALDGGGPPVCLVSEAGASVYSASEEARREFPDLDLTVRGAVSIARRLQDPLAELVKIDPRSIGVGQYQHDLPEDRLRAALQGVVESCVNRVGVDVNLASRELLRHVSGLNAGLAERLVRTRDEQGGFRSREELRSVRGFGEKTFQLAAGFLRVAGAADPLDNSAVHPERYAFVRELARGLGLSVAALVGNRETLRGLQPERFAGGEVGLPTVRDILAELEKPGRDPRDSFRQAELSDAVHSLEDLKPGMELEGTVSNVTNFGAFVDLGIHQDGLVHVSELADRFVRDPRSLVKIGQVVRVRVLEVDAERRRIALSMRPAASAPSIAQPPGSAG